MKFKKILLPTDLSTESMKVFRKGFPFLSEWDAELHFLHVIGLDAFATDYGRTVMSMPDITGQLQVEAEKELKTFAQELTEKRSHPSKTSVVIGNPADAICDYAKKHHIDLIAIPTHGRRGFQHFLLGSVAERVIRFAPCPVLVLRLPEDAK